MYRGQDNPTVESQQPADDLQIKWVDPTSDRFGARLGVEIQNLDPIIGGEGNRPARLERIQDPQEPQCPHAVALPHESQWNSEAAISRQACRVRQHSLRSDNAAPRVEWGLSLGSRLCIDAPRRKVHQRHVTPCRMLPHISGA
jgi:hypothetical protein